VRAREASARPPAVQIFSGALEDGLRREFVYGGDLLVFKGVEPMAELCVLTDELAREALGVSEPVRAQCELDREDYLGRIGALQKRYREHPRVKELFLAALECVGVDLRQTCWDWVHLRVLPYGGGKTDRRTARLGIHRDTWASNVYTQTNWWAPVYPITPGRTIAFYPGYWNKAIANTSSDWDLEEIRDRRRSEATPKKPIPVVPEPTEPVDPASELRMVIEPGDLLCFSGAHLHAGAPNTTGVARFSVEVRTVDARDAAGGRGAPNVDGAAPRVALDWFRCAVDGTPLCRVVGVGDRPAYERM
jgi:hypothetical protein